MTNIEKDILNKAKCLICNRPLHKNFKEALEIHKKDLKRLGIVLMK